jgi:hypothetical protein
MGIVENFRTTAQKATVSAWDTIAGVGSQKALIEQYPSLVERTSVGIPDQVKEAYDATFASLRKKLWQGTLRVAGSGFGKGVLLVAGAVLIGSALVFGMGAMTGALTVGNALLGATSATFAEGAAIGLSQAGNLLLGSWLGPAIMGIGGAIGAVSDVRKHQHKITAEMARAEEQAYVLAREEGLLRELQRLKDESQQTAQTPNTLSAQEPNPFTAREMQRREQQANNPYRGL